MLTIFVDITTPLSWLDQKAKEQEIALQLAQEASEALLLLNESVNESTLADKPTESIVKEEGGATETAQ